MSEQNYSPTYPTIGSGYDDPDEQATDSDNEAEGWEADAPVDADQADDSERDEPEDTGSEARSKGAGLTRQAAKKVIEKYLELDAATDVQLRLLAAVLGGKPDAAELTATIVSAPRTNLGALNELGAIAASATANPFEAVMQAAALSRESSKRIWAVLTGLDAVTGSLPGKDLAAASRIAEAAGALDPTALEHLDAVRQLGRK